MRKWGVRKVWGLWGWVWTPCGQWGFQFIRRAASPVGGGPGVLIQTPWVQVVLGRLAGY